MKNLFRSAYQWMFAEERREAIERFFLFLALGGFVIHLLVILLAKMNWVEIRGEDHGLLEDIVSAIYTPFSFILVYEVFLLVYYLPQSFSISIAKQFEITSLIVLRRIFKDIAKLDIESADWSDSYHVNLLADMVGVLVLVLLIYFFYRLSRKRPYVPPPKSLHTFILIKKGMAVVLVPVLIGLSLFSLTSWIMETQEFSAELINEVSDINDVFYHEFFSLLVLVDVALLMISLFFTDNYSLLIRNAGFVVSTILIRLSFSYDGIQNTILIVLGVSFGVVIQLMYNLIASQEIDSESHSPSSS